MGNGSSRKGERKKKKKERNQREKNNFEYQWFYSIRLFMLGC